MLADNKRRDRREERMVRYEIVREEREESERVVTSSVMALSFCLVLSGKKLK